MKKLIATAIAAIAAATFAALDFNGATATAIVPSATVSAGTTNETVFAASPMKGISEVLVTSAASASRTNMEVTLYATNSVSGGWSAFATTSTTNTAAQVIRLPFPGGYLPKDAKLSISSIGAASTVSAIIFSF